MSLQILAVLAVLPFFCFGHTQECSQRNVSCKDMKTHDGFKFLFNGAEGEEIWVYLNQTLIAVAVPANNSFETSASQVRSMDSQSITIKDCQDLLLKSFFYENSQVEELCLKISPTDLPPPEDGLHAGEQPDEKMPISVIVILGILGILAIGAIVMFFLCYLKKVRWPCGAPVSQFQRLLACLGLDISQAGTAEQGTREMQSASDQARSDENYAEEDIPLDCVHRLESAANGGTPQSVCLDHNLSSNGIRTSENAPDVNRASNQRPMHMNERDDPGGVNHNLGKEKLREKDPGWTGGDRGREGHENEEQPLLVNHRAANKDLGMTGEAVVLVNECGIDPDPVSRCHSASEADVESTPNMKNCKHI